MVDTWSSLDPGVASCICRNLSRKGASLLPLVFLSQLYDIAGAPITMVTPPTLLQFWHGSSSASSLFEIFYTCSKV